MTGDEYMTLLLERQATHEAAHPNLTHPWARPLLEWFIQPGDEDLFTPPPETPQPKRETTPRVYRTAASLRAERDRLDARRAPLARPIADDPAATQGQAIGTKRTARMAAREDGKLRRYVELSERIADLDHRIRIAEIREARA